MRTKPSPRPWFPPSSSVALGTETSLCDEQDQEQDQDKSLDGVWGHAPGRLPVYAVFKVQEQGLHCVPEPVRRKGPEKCHLAASQEHENTLTAVRHRSHGMLHGRFPAGESQREAIMKIGVHKDVGDIVLLPGLLALIQRLPQVDHVVPVALGLPAVYSKDVLAVEDGVDPVHRYTRHVHQVGLERHRLGCNAGPPVALQRV